MWGYCLILLSSAFFCIQNVLVRVLFSPQPVMGLGLIGGYVSPTLSNSFLLLFLRMLLAVPLMAVFSIGVYPKIWADLRQLTHPSQRRSLLHALGGGGLMFTYLALLYLSIGLVTTGVAMTLFFTFPIFTALFAWRLFGHRPSQFQWGIIALVIMGSALTVPLTSPTLAFSLSSGRFLGILFGVLAGVAYALYTINAQKSFEHIHPVPFTWISFATALLLSGGCLIFGRAPQPDLAWTPLWIGSLLSGLVTFAGHVLYNSGIRLVGATTAAMVGTINPALTVILAWVAIQESLTPLQTTGVGIVTLSVAALSQHKPHPT
ncbi:MAG: EamA family transporter [Leptolyngbya sp. RL_3_1]|nr:EamA family transporter [Leptolyngbya sp. RL_3_1]